MIPTAVRPGRLQSRQDTSLAARLAYSAAAPGGSGLATEDFDRWVEGRRLAHPFEVNRIPFAAMEGWQFAEDTGNLVHRSGRFFRVEGLQVRTAHGPFLEWHQPIMVQPEVGILGILAKEIDGVLHFLMQAKMEPGNRPLIQLSPTVQATRSNYTQVHRGSPVKYLDYFAERGRGRVIVDVLQSEHAWWFYRKNNRNVVVEVAPDEEVPAHEDFCWLTLGQLNALMQRDGIVNMSSRSVLACLPAAGPSISGPSISAASITGPSDGFRAALAASVDPTAGALLPTPEVLSWFTGLRAGLGPEITRIPLKDVPGWRRTEDEIGHEDGHHFRIIAVSAKAGSREVAGWTQPLLQPNGLGLAAGIVKEIDGVLHVLMHAKVEGGFGNVVELGPTVQCRPGNYDAAHGPFLYDYMMSAPPGRIRFDTVQAEEGGRFSNAESRYLIVEADDTLPHRLPPEYAWVTVGQLGDLLRHGQYVNMHGRTLIACLNTLR